MPGGGDTRVGVSACRRSSGWAGWGGEAGTPFRGLGDNGFATDWTPKLL
jgi:hypothetical protein